MKQLGLVFSHIYILLFIGSSKSLAYQRVTAFIEQDQYSMVRDALILSFVTGLSTGYLFCPVY